MHARHSRPLLLALAVTLFAWLLPSIALAAEDEQKAPPAPLVTDVWTESSDHRTAGLNGRITVFLTNAPRDQPCSSYVLFIDNRALTGLAPESCSFDDESKLTRIRFVLRRTDQNSDVWLALLQHPVDLTRNYAITLNDREDGTRPFPSEIASAPRKADQSDRFTLRLVSESGFYWFLILGALLVAVWLLAGGLTPLLRERPSEDPDGRTWRELPYSLGLTQMAFWTLLVLLGFVFLWLVTNQTNTISESTLVLLGISAGTALAGGIINAQFDGRAAPKSRGFFRDICGDKTGITLHRIQMLAWTAVLGIIFCVTIYSQLTMPSFNPALLALMGISSGSYIGFKFPEEKSGVPAPAPAGAGDKTAAGVTPPSQLPVGARRAATELALQGERPEAASDGSDGGGATASERSRTPVPEAGRSPEHSGASP